MSTVTVVIPCYNQQSYLHDAIKNLAFQSRRPDAVVVIDDGSRPVLELHSTHGLDIEFLHLLRNGGVPYAMNFGLTRVHTDFVAFIAADDRPRKKWLEIAVRCLEDSKQSLFTAPARFYDPHIKAGWDFRTPGLFSGVWRPTDLYELSLKQYINLASHTAVWRTEALKSFNGFPGQCLWHCDWWATYGFAFQHGLVYYDEILSDVLLSRHSYSAGMRDGELQHNVLNELFSLAKDVPLLWQTLGQHGWPMLQIVRERGPIMVDKIFLKKVLQRESHKFARRLPGFVQRFLLSHR